MVVVGHKTSQYSTGFKSSYSYATAELKYPRKKPTSQQGTSKSYELLKHVLQERNKIAQNFLFTESFCWSLHILSFAGIKKHKAPADGCRVGTQTDYV